mmetsp:Transcript_18058/g.38589  ORF Transcript_18058/g.38589 Transcript_18058/m.38589 type:complete len:251 (-) Transcript_18058:537-1289(-)
MRDEAEIGQADLPSLCQQDVAGLDVAVDQALLVQLGDRFDALSEHLLGGCKAEGLRIRSLQTAFGSNPFVASVDPVPQCTSGDEFGLEKEGRRAFRTDWSCSWSWHLLLLLLCCFTTAVLPAAVAVATLLSVLRNHLQASTLINVHRRCRGGGIVTSIRTLEEHKARVVPGAVRIRPALGAVAAASHTFRGGWALGDPVIKRKWLGRHLAAHLLSNIAVLLFESSLKLHPSGVVSDSSCHGGRRPHMRLA